MTLAKLCCNLSIPLVLLFKEKQFIGIHKPVRREGELYEIERFLKKVSAQQATVIDLTPNVLAWLKEKNLTGKLRVRF